MIKPNASHHDFEDVCEAINAYDVKFASDHASEVQKQEGIMKKLKEIVLDSNKIQQAKTLRELIMMK